MTYLSRYHEALNENMVIVEGLALTYDAAQVLYILGQASIIFFKSLCVVQNPLANLHLLYRWTAPSATTLYKDGSEKYLGPNRAELVIARRGLALDGRSVRR